MQASPEVGQPWPSESLERVDACPLCGSTERHLLYDGVTDRVFHTAAGAWRVYQCASCRSGYVDPRPDEASIHMAYGRYYTHGNVGEAERPRGILARLKRRLRDDYLNHRHGTKERRRMSLAANLLVPTLVPLRLGLDRLARHLHYAKGVDLLDIGCGNGRFLSVARELGWNARGLDPDTAAVEAARESGFDVSLGRLPAAPFPDASFDVVTLSHIIEHTHDPVASLREVCRLLRPGGMIWVSTPNFDGVGRHRFGRNWLSLDPPRHLVLFTPASLQSALEAVGFGGVRRRATTLSDYKTSYAMELGMDPWQHVDLETLQKVGRLPLPFRARAEARLMRVAGSLASAADEVIMTAVKPGAR